MYHGPSYDTINIRLPNDGFLNRPNRGRRFGRHNCHGWIKLGNEYCVKYMPGIQRIFYKDLPLVQCLYNASHHRLDIRFSPKNNGDRVMLCFEDGHPEIKEEPKEYWEKWGKNDSF